MGREIRTGSGIRFTVLLAALFATPSFSQGPALVTLCGLYLSTPSPWGLAFGGGTLYPGEDTLGPVFRGGTLYLSDDSLGLIYKMTTDGTVLDTFAFPGRCLKGMAFHGSDLWVVDDRRVGDSAGYGIYGIVAVDTASGTVTDSIRINAGAVNTRKTNFLWGIGCYESKLYVSYNGGWGPCTFEIDPDTRQVTHRLCCAHPTGLSAIGPSLWCVRENSLSGTGNCLCELSLTDGLREEGPWYLLDCFASDLTFDGEHVWICDNANRQIKVLSGIPTSVRNHARGPASAPGRLRVNPSALSTTIQYGLPRPGAVSLRLLDIRGRVIEAVVNGHQEAGVYSRSWPANRVAAGMYAYRLHSDAFWAAAGCAVVR